MAQRQLERLLYTEHLAHAYVLSGSQAPQLARDFILKLFCRTSCGTCGHCIKLAHGSHPDVLWLQPQGKNVKIEQVRDIQRNALYPPHQARHKVYVIEKAESLSREAANALLKMLESPPPFALFLLLTQHVGELLPTVISRCRLVRVGAAALEQDAFALCWGNPSWLEVFEPTGACAPPEQSPQGFATVLSEKQLPTLHDATRALFGVLDQWSVMDVLQLSAALAKLERPNLEYLLQGLNFLCHQSNAHPAARALEGVHRMSLACGALKANANVQLLVESFLLTLWQLRRS
ncbi:MAG TPA: hypothetical protein VIL47_01935 [Candidatus Bipolaricaulota bacterium]